MKESFSSRNTSLSFVTTVLCIGVVFISKVSFAWVFPEHRDIMYRAIEKLDKDRRTTLDQLWSKAHKMYSRRLSSTVLDTSLDKNETVIDYPAWSAIGGDHSCSPKEMLDIILHSDWILNVVNVTTELKEDLLVAEQDHAKKNKAMRVADFRLQEADPLYVTRAGSNNAHFLLPRENPEIYLHQYYKESLAEGAPVNAISEYSWYHYSALQKATKYAQGGLSEQESTELVLSFLADEAFALHFLEDVFASGHVTGTWGSVSQRKGTHDYYNEFGTETMTWSGKRVILVGDNWMRDEDCEIAARTVMMSIENVIDVASGYVPGVSLESLWPIMTGADTLSICANDYVISRDYDSVSIEQMLRVLATTPIPSLRDGLGQLPRFRSEIGPFVGLSPGTTVGNYFGSFTDQQKSSALVGGLDLSLRLGLGLDGVVNESGDGLVFLDFGIRQDFPSSTKIIESTELNVTGDLLSAIPGRFGLTTRIRMPFYVLPFDLIYMAPLYLISSKTYIGMTIAAVNGGLIGWQSGIATSAGRFQFMLGREVGVSFFGYTREHGDSFWMVGGESGDELSIVGMRTIKLDLPFIEYRPFRTFSTTQSSGLIFQLGTAVDIPTSETQLYPEGVNLPVTKPLWTLYLRMVFNWRSYF